MVNLNLFCTPSPGIKPFQCDRCGKKFTRAYSLKMHRLKHEGKRCFRCQICSATFTSFGEYKHHMRVSRHIIRKPRIYECKTCGAMFTNSGNLIVHLRSLNHEASELANYFQTRWGGAEHSQKMCRSTNLVLYGRTFIPLWVGRCVFMVWEDKNAIITVLSSVCIRWINIVQDSWSGSLKCHCQNVSVLTGSPQSRVTPSSFVVYLAKHCLVNRVFRKSLKSHVWLLWWVLG